MCLACVWGTRTNLSPVINCWPWTPLVWGYRDALTQQSVPVYTGAPEPTNELGENLHSASLWTPGYWWPTDLIFSSAGSVSWPIASLTSDHILLLPLPSWSLKTYLLCRTLLCFLEPCLSIHSKPLFALAIAMGQMFISPKFKHWSPNPQCDGTWRWGTWGCLGHEGGTLMDEISALRRRDMSEMISLRHVRTLEDGHLQTIKWVLTRHQIC